jgi:hypothetical protein
VEAKRQNFIDISKLVEVISLLMSKITRAPSVLSDFDLFLMFPPHLWKCIFTEMKFNKRANFWKTVLAGTDLPNNDKGEKWCN